MACKVRLKHRKKPSTYAIRRYHIVRPVEPEIDCEKEFFGGYDMDAVEKSPWSSR